MISMSKRGEPRRSYDPLNGTTAEDIYFDPSRAARRTKLSGGKGLSEKNFIESKSIWFLDTISENGTTSVSYCRYKSNPKGNETHFKLDTYDCDDEYFKGKPHWIPDEIGYKWTNIAIENSLKSDNKKEKDYAEEVVREMLSSGSTHPLILVFKDRISY